MKNIFNSSWEFTKKASTSSWEFTKRRTKNTVVGTANLSRVTGATFKSSISPISILIAVFIGIIPLIQVFVSHNVSSELYLRSIGMTATFAIMYRAFKALTDNSTLDKNRATYLVYNENQVLFAKLFSDIFIFGLSIAVTTIIAPLVAIFAKGATPLSVHDVANLAYYIIAMLFLYGLISFGLRFFESIFRKNKYKIIAVSVWSVLTVINFLVISIVAIATDSMREWIHAHPYITSFTPFFNLITPSTITAHMSPPSGTVGMPAIQAWKHANEGLMILPSWSVAPMIGESVIFMAIAWKFASKSIKERLCG